MGNWKLNGSKQMTGELIEGLRTALSGVDGCGVAIAPPAIYLDQAKHAISGSHIALGAQNVDVNLSGAFTGETSAEMISAQSTSSSVTLSVALITKRATNLSRRSLRC